MAIIKRARSASECDWVQAHCALTRLARERAVADAEEGRWLLRAFRAAVHVHLGHGSFGEYVERVFGYRRRTTQEKLRVAEALERLPVLARALDVGELGWCSVRELTRVAVPETEDAWLDAARGKTIRQLEELVASKSPGDIPEAPTTALSRSRVLRFEVFPETLALFRDAMLQLRRLAGGGLDDDAVLLAMARHVLAGPTDEGRASYQVSLCLCAACGRGEQLGGGQLVSVGAEVEAMAQCDGQHIGHLLPRAANENGASDAASALPASVHVGASDRAVDVPGKAAAKVPPKGARMGVPQRVLDAPGDATAPVTAHLSVPVGGGPRAKQTIPPTVRRAVLARDQHRCRVPGCGHAMFLDVHHIRPRSEGGRHDPGNLVTVCSVHHRAAHRGELIIEPNHDGSVTFRHADGTAYGHNVAPQLVDASAKVFAGLRHLGFREHEVKVVLAERLTDDGMRGASAERLLREALCKIRPIR